MKFKTSNGILNLPGEWEGVVCFEKQVDGATWQDKILEDTDDKGNPKIGCYYYNFTAAKNLEGGSKNPFFHALVKNTNGTIEGLRPFALDKNTIYVNKSNMLVYIHLSDGLAQAKVNTANTAAQANNATYAQSSGSYKVTLWNPANKNSAHNSWFMFVHTQDLAKISPGPMRSYFTRTSETSIQPQLDPYNKTTWYGFISGSRNLGEGDYVWEVSSGYFNFPQANIAGTLNGDVFDLHIYLFAETALPNNAGIDIDIISIYQILFEDTAHNIMPFSVSVTPAIPYNESGYPISEYDNMPNYLIDPKNTLRIISHYQDNDNDIYNPKGLFIHIQGIRYPVEQ